MKIIINKYTILGGILVFLLLGFYLILVMTGITFKDSGSTTPQAALTVISAVGVPTQDLSLLVETPTATPQPAPTDQNGIALGKFVQISGTGGVGLRIRAGAGTEYDTNFLANESEVFKVIGGPVEANNITWYQLVAPYDESRQGWASAEYLVLIQGQ